MKISNIPLLAILVLSALDLHAVRQPKPNRVLIPIEDTELDKRHVATIIGMFPQPGVQVFKGALKHVGLDGRIYIQWFADKDPTKNSHPYFEVWLNEDCIPYDQPYYNDGQEPKVPGRDVTITPTKQ